MFVLTLLAISSMVSSVWIGRTIQGETIAVNIAGSLRMQSYRIATRLLGAREVDKRVHWQKMQGLIQSFEASLYGPGLINVLPKETDHKVRLAYERVKRQWRLEIRTILDAYINGIRPPDGTKPVLAPQTWGMISDTTVTSLRTRYLARVAKFVDHIDQFVKTLERDAESKIHLLRNWQWIALALTIGVIIFALGFVRRRVIIPLHLLLAGAGAVSGRDFSRKTPHTGKDELGRLGTAFNEMSQTLAKLYQDLEERVRVKTIDLERSNRSLEVLYRTVNRLSATPFPHLAYQGLLEEITMLAKTGPAVICLGDGGKDKAHRLASTRRPDDCLRACKTESCAKCFGDGGTHFFDQPIAAGRLPGDGPATENAPSIRRIISIPIMEAQKRPQEKRRGVLLVESRDERGFADWQQSLLEAVAGHIGIAITIWEHRAEQSRLALLEERSAIARELHDSLAQSLSYAKIQISRMDHMLTKSGKLKDIQAINNELRDGLNHAYSELRELLTTFRLKMDSDSLRTAIKNTVEEYNGRNNISIEVEMDYPEGVLTPNEEIHLLQIIREGILNIVRHAKADRVTIELGRHLEGNIELIIKDNGVGIKAGDIENGHSHYGLIIMHERATSLGGRLAIKSDESGTCLALCFLPAGAKGFGHKQ